MPSENEGWRYFEAGLKQRQKRRLAALNARRAKNGQEPIRAYPDSPRVTDAELGQRLGGYAPDAIESLTEKRKLVAVHVAERTRPKVDDYRGRKGTAPESESATTARAGRIARMWGEQGIQLDELEFIDGMSADEIAEEARYQAGVIERHTSMMDEGDYSDDGGPPDSPLLYH